MDWFLYDDGLRHEMVKVELFKKNCFAYFSFYADIRRNSES